VLLTLLGIAAVTALVIVAWTRGEPQKETPVGVGETPAAKAPTKKRAAPARVGVRLVITAENGSSWVRVLRNPPNGREIFKNWIDREEERVFGGRTLWVEATAPQALVLTVNGRRVEFPEGARAATITQRGLTAAPR
jgi:hypothetical protein